MSNIVPLEKLKSVVGEEAFGELVSQFPGKNIYIPKNFDEKFHDRKKRNKVIRKDYQAGMEIPELMNKYGLSKATIYKIIEQR